MIGIGMGLTFARSPGALGVATPSAPLIGAFAIQQASPRVGDTVTTALAWTGTPQTGVSYQWTLDGSPISGANSSSYVAEAEGALRCVVTIDNGAGTATATAGPVTVLAAGASASFSIVASTATSDMGDIYEGTGLHFRFDAPAGFGVSYEELVKNGEFLWTFSSTSAVAGIPQAEGVGENYLFTAQDYPDNKTPKHAGQARGPFAAHVFKTAGTHRVVCRARYRRSDGTIVSAPPVVREITVLAQSITDRFYIDMSGDFADAAAFHTAAQAGNVTGVPTDVALNRCYVDYEACVLASRDLPGRVAILFPEGKTHYIRYDRVRNISTQKLLAATGTGRATLRRDPDWAYVGGVVVGNNDWKMESGRPLISVGNCVGLTIERLDGLGDYDSAKPSRFRPPDAAVEIAITHPDWAALPAEENKDTNARRSAVVNNPAVFNTPAALAVLPPSHDPTRGLEQYADHDIVCNAISLDTNLDHLTVQDFTSDGLRNLVHSDILDSPLGPLVRKDTFVFSNVRCPNWYNFGSYIADYTRICFVGCFIEQKRDTLNFSNEKSDNVFNPDDRDAEDYKNYADHGAARHRPGNWNVYSRCSWWTGNGWSGSVGGGAPDDDERNFMRSVQPAMRLFQKASPNQTASLTECMIGGAITVTPPNGGAEIIAQGGGFQVSHNVFEMNGGQDNVISAITVPVGFFNNVVYYHDDEAEGLGRGNINVFISGGQDGWTQPSEFIGTVHNVAGNTFVFRTRRDNSDIISLAKVETYGAEGVLRSRGFSLTASGTLEDTALNDVSLDVNWRGDWIVYSGANDRTAVAIDEDRFTVATTDDGGEPNSVTATITWAAGQAPTAGTQLHICRVPWYVTPVPEESIVGVRFPNPTPEFRLREVLLDNNLVVWDSASAPTLQEQADPASGTITLSNVTPAALGPLTEFYQPQADASAVGAATTTGGKRVPVINFFGVDRPTPASIGAFEETAATPAGWASFPDAATVTVAWSKATVEVGDVIGTDITLDPTIVVAGSPAITTGDVTIQYQLVASNGDRFDIAAGYTVTAADRSANRQLGARASFSSRATALERLTVPNRLIVADAGGVYTPAIIDNQATAYLDLGPAMVESQQLTFVTRVRLKSAAGSTRRLAFAGSNNFALNVLSSRAFSFNCTPAGVSTSNSPVFAVDEWVSLMAVIDTRTVGNVLDGSMAGDYWINGQRVTALGTTLNSGTRNDAVLTELDNGLGFLASAVGSNVNDVEIHDWVWVGAGALNPSTHWSDFFNADGTPKNIAANPVIGGVTPRVFIQGADAWTAVNGVVNFGNGGSPIALGAGAFVEVPQVEFGALTLAGAGGVPAPEGATAISGGTATGYTLTGGFVAPTSNGSATSGTLTFTGSTVTWSISAVSGEASARTQAEFETAAALGNLIVRMRPEAYPAWTPSSLSLTAVTLAQEPGAEFLSIRGSGITGLIVDGLSVRNNNPTNLTPLTANAAIVLNTSTVTLRNMAFNCRADNEENYRNRVNRLPALSATGSTITVEDSTFEYVQDGCAFNSCTATVTGNAFRYFLVDCITGLKSNWTVSGNTATLSDGWSGRRLTGASFTGTIAEDDIIARADGHVGQVFAVGSDFVDVRYIGPALPPSSGSYTGPSGSFTYTGSTTAYDGPHGDFFQPLLNETDGGATAVGYSVSCSQNFVYRTVPYVKGVMEQENVWQGVLMQLNGSQHFFDDPQITNNIIACGQSIGITLNGATDGIVQFNTVLASPDTGAATGIRVSDCDGVSITRNLGSRVLDVSGNTGCTFENNVAAGDTPPYGDLAALPAAEPWNTLAFFAPGAETATQTALAGALRPNATYRVVGDIPVPASIAVVATQTAVIASSQSSGATSAIAGGGSANQMLVVQVTLESSSSVPENISGITWNGENLLERSNIISTGNFLRQAVYTLALGTSSASSVVTVSFATNSGSKGALVSAAIVEGVPQDAPTVRDVADLGNTTFPRSETETVAAASVVLAAWSDGISSSSGSVTSGAGVTPVTSQEDGTASCAHCMGFVVMSGAGDATMNATGPAAGSRTLYSSLVWET